MNRIRLILLGFTLGIFTGGILGYSIAEKDAESKTIWIAPEIDCHRHGKSGSIHYHDGFRECIYCKRCYGEFLNKNLTEIIRDTELSEPSEPEPMFELVPNSIEPTSKGAIWLESNEIPPPSIFYYDGDKKIKYIPIFEPNEPETFTIEMDTNVPSFQDTIAWTKEVFLEITLTEKPIFVDGEHRIYLYKGEEFDIVIEKKEPSEPTAWDDLGEMDEPGCKHEITIACAVSGCECITCFECGKQLTEPIHDLLPIANHIDSVDILSLIPTWPDYIELEKELRIDLPDNKTMSAGWWFPKGTKIYFKDKAE